MSGRFWSTDEQMVRLRPAFPKSRGRPRVEYRRVLSGIYIRKNGVQWTDAFRVWAAEDALRSGRSLAPQGRVRPDLR